MGHVGSPAVAHVANETVAPFSSASQPPASWNLATAGWHDGPRNRYLVVADLAALSWTDCQVVLAIRAANPLHDSIRVGGCAPISEIGSQASGPP